MFKVKISLNLINERSFIPVALANNGYGNTFYTCFELGFNKYKGVRVLTMQKYSIKTYI